LYNFCTTEQTQESQHLSKGSEKMLTVYTCHSQKMPAQRRHRMAAMPLPKWIQGTPSEDHEFLRTSAATRTWEQAEEKARKLEDEARPVCARRPQRSRESSQQREGSIYSFDLNRTKTQF
jgi:hypothetical protein